MSLYPLKVASNINSKPSFKGIPKLDAAPPDKNVDIPILISSAFKKLRLEIKRINKKNFFIIFTLSSQIK